MRAVSTMPPQKYCMPNLPLNDEHIKFPTWLLTWLRVLPPPQTHQTVNMEGSLRSSTIFRGSSAAGGRQTWATQSLRNDWSCWYIWTYVWFMCVSCAESKEKKTSSGSWLHESLVDKDTYIWLVFYFIVGINIINSLQKALIWCKKWLLSKGDQLGLSMADWSGECWDQTAPNGNERPRTGISTPVLKSWHHPFNFHKWVAFVQN